MSDFDHGELTGAVMRAARALIEISAAELAAETRVGERTILRAEKENGRVRIRAANALAIIAALERRGVTFVAGNEQHGPGLILSAPLS